MTSAARYGIRIGCVHHFDDRTPAMTNGNTAPAATSNERGLVVREALSACDLGNTLFLKLCGFIQDQQARLLEVEEDNYRLQIGYSRWERFWHGLRGHNPVVVTLAVRRDESPEWDRRSHASQAIVEIAVRPAGIGWQAREFESCAQHIVRRLRLHLMAG
ncbi:MAG: hypothetical protein JNG89_16435 [Planctomycetaceae bacterium]|nr:hypothetical protein [Planctomycetaceae bacterium]